MIKTNLRQTNIVALVLVVAMIFMVMPAQASFIRSDWEFGKRNVANTLTASADLTESIHLDLSMAFTGEMEKMSTTAKLDYLSLSHTISPNVNVSLGKQSHQLGRARLNPLFFSEQSPAFLSARYDLNYDKWSYSKIYGDFSVNNDYKRLGAHYLSGDINKYLSLGIGEAFITLEPFRGDLVYAATPFLPYYLAKYLPGIPSATDSSLVYLDSQINLNLVSLYGELIVSEFPMTPNAVNPALYGFTVGTELKLNKYSIIAEHSRVMNYTYSNSHIDTAFIYDNHPVGHPLGQDFKKYDIQLQSQESILSKIGLYHQVIGEGRVIDQWYKDNSERIENRFLSGVNETTVGVVLGLRTELTDTLMANLETDVGYAKNLNNIEGHNDYVYQAKLSITWSL